MHPSFGGQDRLRGPVEEAINSINAEHLWTLRIVRGKDLNEHAQQIIEWEQERQYEELLALLEEIIDVTHTLVQYDSREPQGYWASKAATVYLKLGRRDEAIRALARWLEAWPESRGPKPERDQIRRRVTKLMNKNT